MRRVEQARNLRFIVSGGGTGGHIFPAVAIADELKRRYPTAEFLFVGAEGKMEMEKVPKAGYRIVGLPVRGLLRKLTFDNLLFPIRLVRSVWKSRRLIREFEPDIVIGTGGYAGGPVLYAAAKAGIPTLIQEPNAFAGLANKWLGRYVDKICVAFEGMERFFPAEKLVITGNPVRESLLDKAKDFKVAGSEASSHVLLMGGSGGARSLNETLSSNTELIASRPDIFWTWQCGQFYYEQFKDCATAQLPNVRIAAFLDQMDVEYGKADLVIGRAGSTTISETQYLGKPAIFVPSPWVTEDHQTKNALALTTKDAAVLVPDAEASEKLVRTVFELFDDSDRLTRIGANALTMAQPGAVGRIADEIMKMVPADRHPRRQVYFIGIGGIGMSALARYYHYHGYRVSGYDKTKTALTEALEAEGIAVHYAAHPEGLNAFTKEDTLFIYTPAVPADFPELVALRERGIEPMKRSEALGLISKDKKTVAIAGTHGKTTTTTMATHLLRECGIDTSAFLGGIARNFNGNYVHGKSDWVTVEADEYDRSFLRLHPRQAVILSMDADHLDIYGDHANMLETGFKAFARQIDASGCLVVRHELVDHFTDLPAVRVMSFGLGRGDYRGENIRVEDGMFVFDLFRPNGDSINGLRLPLPGRHNVENAVAAIAMTLEAGGDAAALPQALASFRGIGRRFETVLKTEERVVIDDYAHHPTELKAAIGAARELYPDRKIRGVFQPHLYSRTRDFADGFAEALDLLDEAILLPIYPAREKPIAGVTSEMLLGRMQNDNKRLLTKEELLPYLAGQTEGVLLMLGAGDIDALVGPVVDQLQNVSP